MLEKVVTAQELTPTFIHCTNPGCANGRKKIKTTAWLNQMLSDGKCSEIPAMTAVRDDESARLLVYDGNIRQAHALENDYPLKALILASQADLDEYRKTRPTCWFRIADWSELLKFMRMYAEYPGDEQEIPAAFREMLANKQHEIYLERERDLFGPDDDE
jgi:hypothetical protein